MTSQWVRGVSNHQPRDCLLSRSIRRRSQKAAKFCVTGLCAGNSPVTGKFPAQMASNAKKSFHLMTSSCCFYGISSSYFIIRIVIKRDRHSIAKLHGCDVLPYNCTTTFAVDANAEGFLPPPPTEWCIHKAKHHAHVVLLLSQIFFVNILAFFKLLRFFTRANDASARSAKHVVIVTPQRLLVTSWLCSSPCALVYIDLRFIFICCIFLSGKTMWDWIDRCF